MDAWLADARDALAQAAGVPAERLAMWPVDGRVGNVKNEGPELAEPAGEILI